MSWSAVSGATLYNIYEDLGAGLVLAGTSTTTSFSSTIAAGTSVRWQVGAVVPSCAEIRSSFEISSTTAPAPVCPTTGPSIVAPASGATVAAGSVAMSWSAVSGATLYNIYEDLGAGLVLAGTSASTTFTTGAIAAGSNVRWQIGAVVPTCTEIRSSIATFTIPAAPPVCPAAAPSIVAPTANATVPAGMVSLTWTAIAGATSYNVYENLGAGLALAGTSTTTSFATNVAAASSVQWRVGAVIPAARRISLPIATFATAPAAVTCPTLTIAPAALPSATVGTAPTTSHSTRRAEPLLTSSSCAVPCQPASTSRRVEISMATLRRVGPHLSQSTSPMRKDARARRRSRSSSIARRSRRP